MTDPMSDGIPFVDLKAGYVAYKEELNRAIFEVLDNTDFILGSALSEFEEAFAEFCEVDHAVGVGNGTDALELALAAAGIQPGDEVVTVSHTYAATVSAIVRVGAMPVLVDVDPEHLLIDPARVEEAISDRTTAIVAVHLYGTCAPLDELRRITSSHGLLLIEDAAQAHGARYGQHRAGSVGDLATFSFYPSKNLGAYGDGGAVVTNDARAADRVGSLRDHGKRDKFTHQDIGRNSRLDSIQAAVLLTKLAHLDDDNKARRSAFELYLKGASERGLNARFVQAPGNVEPVHHLCVIRIPDRDRVIKALDERGIACGIHYPIPVHLQPGFAGSFRANDLPVTEAVVGEILSLPMWAQISTAQIERVLDELDSLLPH